MPSVFIPHEVKHASKNGLVSQFDFSDAKRFGELKVADFAKGAFEDQLRVDASVDYLRQFLAGFKEGDYLLAVGDPVAITAAAGLLAKCFKVINVLRWDKEQKRYYSMEISI